MTELEFTQLELEAAIAARQNAFAQRALHIANATRQDAVMATRITMLQEKVELLTNPIVEE